MPRPGGLIGTATSDYPDDSEHRGRTAVLRSTPPVRCVLAIALLATAAGCAGRTRQPDLEPGERRAFRASSMHTESFIVGDFAGVVEVWRDSLMVFVTSGRIDARGEREDEVVLDRKSTRLNSSH